MRRVILPYSDSGGVKWIPIQTYIGTSPGIHSWTIPTVTAAKTKCQVKVALGRWIGEERNSLSKCGHRRNQFLINPFILENLDE
jgi:hypothetical protein